MTRKRKKAATGSGSLHEAAARAGLSPAEYLRRTVPPKHLQEIRAFAEAIGRAADVVAQTAGQDPDLLELLRKRVEGAAYLLSQIEAEEEGRDQDADRAWSLSGAWTEPEIRDALLDLPVLAIALKSATEDPTGRLAARDDEAWFLVSGKAARVAARLTEWVRRHSPKV